MKALVIVTIVCLSFGLVAQNDWTVDDSIKGQRMIETIEQSLLHYYQDQAPKGNYDSIIELLEAESAELPKFSDSVYCQRLNQMNEMSPFHLDCNQHTLKAIKFFVEKRRGFSRVVLGRSALYFDMYEEKLAKHDMPIELKYLSVIESGLRPQVKSRAGALGLWQFMYRTGRMMGLKENSYIDERMDPDKATEAACKYLKMLYEMYEDWNLALAAYNAGPGNVNKAIRRSGNKKTYWEIRPYLPRETQGYVPNFIAAAYLLTHHIEHHIVPAVATVRYAELDTICLSNGVHMSTISELLSVQEDEIKRLNPVYKSNYIPKSTPNQCVMLPLDKIGQLVTLEDSLYALEVKKFVKIKEAEAPSVKPGTGSTVNSGKTTYQYHKVRSGETLGTIASRFGTTVREIQRINGLSSTKIYVGQRLKVKPGAKKPVANTQTSTVKRYYTVRSGDTFGGIAQRHKKSISQLRRLNPRINISRLSIGQKIRVK